MLTLINARIIDGTGAQPKDNATVVIDDNRHISAVRDGTPSPDQLSGEVIDLQGRTLLPGLINAHMHIMLDAGPNPTIVKLQDMPAILLKAAKRGEQILHAGITTARDLGGMDWAELALRDAFATGEYP